MFSGKWFYYVCLLGPYEFYQFVSPRLSIFWVLGSQIIWRM